MIKPLDFVVVSTPLADYQRTSKILTRVGITCHTHRYIGDWWFEKEAFSEQNIAVGDATYCAAPYIDTLLPETAILHQVINPMYEIPLLEKSDLFANWETDYMDSYKRDKCGNKFIKYQGRTWGWPESVSDRVLMFYEKWHQMIEEKSKGRRYFRFRYEDLEPNLVKQICKFIGGKYKDDLIAESLIAIEKKDARPTMSWERASDGVKDIGYRYGYPVYDSIPMLL